METHERRYLPPQFPGSHASRLRHEALAAAFALVLLVIASGAATHMW